VRIWSVALLAIVSLGSTDVLMGTKGYAQDRRILKSGESIELHTVYYVNNCRSLMIGLPEVEVLEGPQQVTLSIKEAMVLPRRQNCANKVPGGILSATARDVAEPMETKITYRVNYKTKDGARQVGRVYFLSLFP
jgi:hypothetical protein